MIIVKINFTRNGLPSYAMPVTIKTVTSKSDLKKFIFLSEHIHREHANWVPPIYADEWAFYNAKYNKQLLHSDTVLFLAVTGGKPVGRIMGIINNKYNAFQGESTARFYNLDCPDNGEISHALIDAVEKWAFEKGMRQIIGPFGFSDKDPQGLQVEGFENLPVIATPTNLPYLQTLVEKQGYKKKIDCLSYRLDIPAQIPAVYQRVYDRRMQSKQLTLVEFKTRQQLRPFIVPVLRLVNETYKSIFGFVPLEEEEMHQLAKKYLPLLDPAFTKLVTDTNNNPLAFVIASPDISKGIQKAKGRLFPFGFIHILASAKKTKQLDLFLGAVRQDYQGSGIIALLAISIFNSALQRKLQYIDSHLILESNSSMRAVMERLDAIVYKRYRIYKKDIVAG
jgi:hypothetical protein